MPAFKRLRDKLPRDGALFLTASLVAGLGHYAFQVLASRRLSGSEFAALSSWHAHLSLGLTLAGLAQYAANFHPWPRARLAPALTVLNVVAIVLSGAWTFGADPLGPVAGLAVCLLAVIFGWTMGQAQIRLDFTGLAYAQLAVAAGKLAVPVFMSGGLSKFTLAIGACYLPGLWIVSSRLREAPDAGTATPRAWGAPIILSLAANLIPQFDLLVTRHTVSAEAFDDFAHASLFYKGIYFAVFIFAQWVLPRQIRGDRSAARLTWACAFAGAASLGLSLTAPLFARYVFAWSVPPDRTLIFLSCVHMSLLTLIFLNIQAACAVGALVRAAAPLALLAFEAALQLTLGLSTLPYLIVVVLVQALWLLAGLRFHSRRPA